MNISQLLVLRPGEWVFVREKGGRLRPERMDRRPDYLRIERVFKGVDIRQAFCVNKATRALLQSRPDPEDLTIGDLLAPDPETVRLWIMQERLRASAITERAEALAKKIREAASETGKNERKSKI